MVKLTIEGSRNQQNKLTKMIRDHGQVKEVVVDVDRRVVQAIVSIGEVGGGEFVDEVISNINGHVNACYESRLNDAEALQPKRKL